MLFQRYASPTVLLEKMANAGRLTEFIGELITIQNEEVRDKTLWETWLHKEFEKSFDEFTQGTRTAKKAAAMPSKDEIETTIKDSVGLLDLFKPD